jgi:hypothetical protein
VFAGAAVPNSTLRIDAASGVLPPPTPTMTTLECLTAFISAGSSLLPESNSALLVAAERGMNSTFRRTPLFAACTWLSAWSVGGTALRSADAELVA